MTVVSDTSKVKASEKAETPELTPVQTYVKQLREMARWLEQHPNVPLGYKLPFTISIFASWCMEDEETQKQVLRRTAKAMGKGQKRYEGSYIVLEHTLPSGAKYEMNASRDETCKRKQVGTKTVTIPATPAIPAKPEKTMEEPVYVWECEPLLDSDGRE